MSRNLDSSTTTQMAEIMVQYGRPSRSSWTEPVRTSFGRTVMGNPIWEDPIEIRLGQGFPIWNVFSYTVKKGYSHLCMWMTSNWLERNKTLIRCGKVLNKEFDLGEHLSLIMKTWDALKDNAKQAKILWTITEPCLNREFQREEQKSFHTLHGSLWYGRSCKETCGAILWVIQQDDATTLQKLSTPCIDDHRFKEEEMKSVGEVSQVCSKIVLKCLYLARIGRPDILWSVNKLARSITKWTKACDKRVNRLISYIHHTCEHRQ